MSLNGEQHQFSRTTELLRKTLRAVEDEAGMLARIPKADDVQLAGSSLPPRDEVSVCTLVTHLLFLMRS